jgi:hypothetical protein
METYFCAGILAFVERINGNPDKILSQPGDDITPFTVYNNPPNC